MCMQSTILRVSILDRASVSLRYAAATQLVEKGSSGLSGNVYCQNTLHGHDHPGHLR